MSVHSCVDAFLAEPGPPAMFDVHARGPTHFELRWEKPPETNGILIGYNISYQTSNTFIIIYIIIM